jgi:aerobic carbon-monoxide dehydrogenase medium subunit
VIPTAFDYVRADTVDAALASLGEHGDEAKLLAGGHSLVPLMKLRLAAPAVIVDIGRLDTLAYIRADGAEIAIGALTRLRDIERSPLLAAQAPILAHAAGHVGDPQVRNRATLGGSIAHGDGASDLPAVVLALGGSMVVSGPRGTRTIPAGEFFLGFLECAVGPDEMLLEVRIPVLADAGWSFQKFNRRAQDWAIVGCAVVRSPIHTGVGLVNMATTPVRARATETALAAGASMADAAAVADEDTSPASDLAGSEEYRRHLCRVLVRRGLEEATAGAHG